MGRSAGMRVALYGEATSPNIHFRTRRILPQSASADSEVMELPLMGLGPDDGSGCDFRSRKHTRHPAASVRPLSSERDARVMAASPGYSPTRQLLILMRSGRNGLLQRTVRLNRCRRRSLIIRANARVARVGVVGRMVLALAETIIALKFPSILITSLFTLLHVSII
jgi:hypothetical protein